MASLQRCSPSFFLTRVWASSHRGSARSNVAFFLLRNYFFVDKDEALVADLRRQLTHDLPDPHYIDTLLDVFKFIFSENFVAF